MVNELDMSRYRLTRLLFDLGRLNEALADRVSMFERLDQNLHPLTAILSNHLKQSFIAVISFINRAVEDHKETNESRAQAEKQPEEIFDDFMKRMRTP